MALVEVLPILSLSLLDLKDSGSLAIFDTSRYPPPDIDADFVALQITPPGYETINVPFTPSYINVYKCVDLGITCADSCCPLPDGIYAVTYTVSPDAQHIGQFVTTSIDLKFIKIDLINCKYEKMFLKVNVECSCHDHTQKPMIEELRRIKLLIDGSVSACNDSNYPLSYELYNKANTMLDKICCKFKGTNYTNLNYSSNVNTGCGFGCGC